MIFANKTAAAVWKESHCDRCFQPDQMAQRESGRGRGCPILYRAMVNKVMPAEFSKGRNGAVMAEAFRCGSFIDRPALARPRTVAVADDEAGLF